MRVVSHDVIWPLSQIRVLLQNSPNLHVRRLHQLFMSARSREVAEPFSSCDGTRGPLWKPTSMRENMVAVNADALICLTPAVLPAISPTPLRYRLPLWSPTTAT